MANLLGGTLAQLAADRGIPLQTLQQLNPQANTNTTYTVGELQFPTAAGQSAQPVVNQSPVQPAQPVQPVQPVQPAQPVQPQTEQPKPNQPPEGWDATTYANFKKANPTLEPDAQDTKRMKEAIQYTPSQTTNSNNQVYKEWNNKTNSWDVFNADGSPMDLATFQSKGLNIDHINTQAGIISQSGSSSQSGADSGGTEPTDPYKTFNDAYTAAITSSGMLDIKSEFDKVQQSYNDLSVKMSEEVMAVNDNPWLSEGLRAKKIGLIQDKYQTQQDALTRQTNLYQGLYDSAKQDAQFQATTATNIAHNQAVLDQQLLLARMDAAEKLASAKLDTQVVEHDGNKYLVDLQTGDEMLLGKATGSAGSETDKQVAEANAIQTVLEASKQGGQYVDGNVYLAQRIKSRMSLSEFDGRFGQLLSPEDRTKYGIGKTTTTFENL